jgi:hypothetical protein
VAMNSARVRCTLPGVMICPQCHAEYRDGYSSCADCHVALVHDLPRQSREDSGHFGSPPTPGDPDQDPFCSFWQGDDARIHAELCELLEEEGIAHKTIRREDHLFNINSKSAFQIGIPFSQFEKAEAAVKDAYGMEGEQQDANRLLPYREGYAPGVRGVFPWRPQPQGFESPRSSLESDQEYDVTPIPEAPADVAQADDSLAGSGREDWDPDDATVEVWSGAESYPGEFIVQALQENQIHSRFDQRTGRYAIYVMADDEKRAREIVREIVEGEPPE